MSHPLGEERHVNAADYTAIDGAPISFVIVLASVIMAMALVPIPISIVVGSGKNFPLSQGLYPLLGWLLGPVAGGFTNAIGAFGGSIIAPHTTTSRLATVIGAAYGGLVAGVMNGQGKRKRWWIPVAFLAFLFYALYAGRAVFINGAHWPHVILGSFIDWSALLLFILPSRDAIARALKSHHIGHLSTGLFIGTWIAAGMTHLCTGMIVYAIINWPSEYWLVFAPLAPLEHSIRCIVGMVIGTGVITGLRSIGLYRPKHGLY